MGLLTDGINNKLEINNLINEHALTLEPVALKQSRPRWQLKNFTKYAEFVSSQIYLVYLASRKNNSEIKT